MEDYGRVTSNSQVVYFKPTGFYKSNILLRSYDTSTNSTTYEIFLLFWVSKMETDWRSDTDSSFSFDSVRRYCSFTKRRKKDKIKKKERKEEKTNRKKKKKT